MDGPLIRFAIVSMITTFLGSQTVHMIYKPLDDVDELVEKELARRRAKESRKRISKTKSEEE